MRKPASMWGLETFGRQRLSRYYFMRDFMYSEISGFHGRTNIPENPELLDGLRCVRDIDPQI
jgi:hypothetical protein